MVALKILVLVVGVRVLPGKIERPLRLSARTGDSHSSKRGSIPLGAKTDRRMPVFLCAPGLIPRGLLQGPSFFLIFTFFRHCKILPWSFLSLYRQGPFP
jgi:hypothetical protein